MLDLSRREDAGRILFLVFYPRLTLALAEVVAGAEYYLGDEAQIGSVRYRDKGYGNFSVFSDWLRNADGQVVGVRFWLEEGMQFLTDYMSQLPYIGIAQGGKALEVYFGTERQIDEENSADQDFATNKVFSSDLGKWAISLHATHLSPLEMAGVYAADADWKPASVTILPEDQR